MENALISCKLSEHPVLIYCPHPLFATADRDFFYECVLPGESLAGYLDRIGVDLAGRQWLLTLNDVVIPRDAWAMTFPGESDLIVLQVLTGDDGGDSNKVIRTIATLAVMVASAYTGGLAGAMIAIGGGLAVAKLFPPILPPIKTLRGDRESPTYSVSGGSNRGRPFEPMPCVLGQHRIFPDLGARTYTEFQGDDQYLYQVFHFGLTDMVLSDFRIGETPITDYADYTLEESSAGNWQLNLFPANVNTAAGADLTFSAGWVTRTSGLDATALSVEVSGFLFYSGDDGIEARSVVIGLEYRAVGDTTWLPFEGSGEVTITHASRQPLRWGSRIVVAQGQYEVRLRRVSADETDNRATSNITWTQLRTYQPDMADYSEQKRVALKIRANEQLQGQIQQFSALATLQAEVWTGLVWDVQPTSNPAWLFRYWARGKLAGGRRLFGGGLADADLDIEAIKEWGAWCDAKGLTCNLVFDREMSVEQQLAIIARCGRGHPTRASGKLGVVWDESNQPAVAHFGMANIRRGSFVVRYASKPDFDEVAVNFINPALNWQADTVRALVPGVTTPENTLTVDLMGCTDEVMAGKEANLIAAETRYRRRAITFETDFEGHAVTRGDVISLSHDLTKWGQSGRLKAGTNTALELDRTVPFTAGFNHYLRLVYPDGTDEIFPVSYVAGESASITLGKQIVKSPWQAGEALVLDDERAPTVFNGFFYVVTAAGTTGATEPGWPTTEGDTVTDGTVVWRNAGSTQKYYPDNHPVYGPMDYKWSFDPKATPGKLAKITDIRPLDAHFVRLTCVDEDDDYYLSENNGYTYVPVDHVGDTPAISKLEISDTLINMGNSFGVRITLAWDVTGAYGFAVLRAAHAGEPLQVIRRTFGRRVDFIWNSLGFVDVEVTVYSPDGRFQANGRQLVNYAIVGQDRDPPDVANFRAEVDNNGLVLRWDDVNVADLLDYEVRVGADWDTGTLLARIDSNELSLDWPVAGAHTWYVKARNASSPRRYSTNPASASLTVTGAAPPAISDSFEGENLVLSYSLTPGSLPIREVEISYGTVEGESVVATLTSDRFRTKASWIGTRRWWVTPVDVAGNRGTGSAVDVEVVAPQVTGLTRRVVDNQAVLSWSGTPGTLPIDVYAIYKGDVFSSAEFLGEQSGTFNVIVELTAGTYTYWVEPVDVAGNRGTPVSTVALVNAPPDFVLREDWYSTFAGTKTNAFLDQNGDLLVPVNTSETWADHFVNNGWNTPDDQIGAGFDYYAMPGNTTTSAVYEETFDYGTVLEGTLITVLMNLQVLAGGVNVTVTISTRRLATDPWDDYVGVTQIFATDFQYVKVRLDFAETTAASLALLTQMNVQLSVKQITDEGNATANAGDTSGTVVLFNKSFVAVESINITAHGSTAVTAVVDFPNTPNPTQFAVYLFNASGARVSGDFSWNARGN